MMQKALDIESNYFTTAAYNKFTTEKLDAKMMQKGLVDKSALAGFINNTGLDKKKQQHQQNKLNKTKTRQNNKNTSI